MATRMMDLAVTSDGDVWVGSGDFGIVESTSAHQKELLLNNPDEYRQNPGICVGVWNFMDDENFFDLIRQISLRFARDGMQVNSIRVDAAGVIVSDAYYP